MPKVRDRRAEYELHRLSYRRKSMSKRELSDEQKKKLRLLDMEYAVALRKHMGLET